MLSKWQVCVRGSRVSDSSFALAEVPYSVSIQELWAGLWARPWWATVHWLLFKVSSTYIYIYIFCFVHLSVVGGVEGCGGGYLHCQRLRWGESWMLIKLFLKIKISGKKKKKFCRRMYRWVCQNDKHCIVWYIPRNLYFTFSMNRKIDVNLSQGKLLQVKLPSSFPTWR